MARRYFTGSRPPGEPPVYMRHARPNKSPTRGVPLSLRVSSADDTSQAFDASRPRNTPVSFAEFERSFWARVWRCRHRHPCKRCCWPWRAVFAGGKVLVRPTYGHVYVPYFHRQMVTHKVALIIAHGALILPFGTPLQVCHLCGFPPCCNPKHLVLGTPYDNTSRGPERIAGRLGMRGPIHLPNGVNIMIDYRLLRRIKTR